MTLQPQRSAPALTLLAAGAALLAVVGCSGKGRSSSPTAPPGGGSNHAPTLNVSADSTRMLYGNFCTIRVTASDPDGDQLSLSYVAAGGTASASGPTATIASFTGTRIGNDSVTVSASDGHGGVSSASALIYVIRAGPPEMLGYKMVCAWRGVPGESLIVLDGWAAGPVGSHDIAVDGGLVPCLIRPGYSVVIGSVDPCTGTLDTFHARLQRMPPDSRIYDTDLH